MKDGALLNFLHGKTVIDSTVFMKGPCLTNFGHEKTALEFNLFIKKSCLAYVETVLDLIRLCRELRAGPNTCIQ